MPTRLRRPVLALILSKLLLIISWALPLATASPAIADEAAIAVVVSSEIRPYLAALEGLRSGLSHSLEIYYVNRNPELVRHRLVHSDFDVVIAIGPEASKLVWSAEKDMGEKMTLMVLDPQKVLDDAGLCGIDLRIPIREQISLTRKRLGAGRNIGILYNPQENQEWVGLAVTAGSELGVKISPLEVDGKKDAIKTLAAAYGSIDTLLFIPDSTVISETLVSHLIKEALLHGIAAVGYNHFFVEAGAVMSFNIQYDQVGMMGARLAQAILAGSGCGLSPPPFETELNERAWQLVVKGLEDTEPRTQGGTPQ
jgi:putative ABC transport system substrate-binding protein